VQPGDLLCDIQTDKAVVGFEVEEEGILAKILVHLHNSNNNHHHNSNNNNNNSNNNDKNNNEKKYPFGIYCTLLWLIGSIFDSRKCQVANCTLIFI